MALQITSAKEITGVGAYLKSDRVLPRRFLPEPASLGGAYRRRPVLRTLKICQITRFRGTFLPRNAMGGDAADCQDFQIGGELNIRKEGSRKSTGN